MIVLLTVLTVAEITRMSAAAAATVKCSTPSAFSDRGYRSAGLENTLPAFGRALEAGSARIEFPAEPRARDALGHRPTSGPDTTDATTGQCAGLHAHRPLRRR
ncbi:hypothetical protein SAMN05216276_103555 [Streptosporangium subroseum]|uniref:Uncharacterized protein n=1 Tax=Streptosporangium subroseum TaxID=106412 RepID=A0A239LVD1_9ACTN|nr:hypothetical protein [Streptosporangium subroseum]SNT34210.1 hypothetical protein SAMN05216276_103555 [Streptosporangium subroseum]